MAMSAREALARLVDLFGPQATWDPTKLYGNLMVSPAGNILIGSTTDDASHKLQVNGAVTSTGGVISNGYATDGYGQFRAISGNYGVMIRNDGAACYLLSTASGAQSGIYNGYRPFYWNLSNGTVTINGDASGTTIGGPVSLLGSATSTVTTTTSYGAYLTNADIGMSWAQWNGATTPTAVAALQVNTFNPNAAYLGVRWTHWGTRHIAGISGYESGTVSSTCIIAFSFNSNVNSHVFYDGGAATFAGALTQNSDYRIKTNIEVVDPQAALAQVMRLMPKEYDRVEDHHLHGRQPGFIAHEIGEVFPLLVKGEKDAVKTIKKLVGDTRPFQEGEEPEDYVPPTEVEVEVPDPQSVNYIGMIPYLVASIQALKQTVDAQAQEIAQLKAAQQK